MHSEDIRQRFEALESKIELLERKIKALEPCKGTKADHKWYEHSHYPYRQQCSGCGAERAEPGK